MPNNAFFRHLVAICTHVWFYSLSSSNNLSLFSKNDLTPFSSNPEMRSGKYLTDSKRPFYLTQYIKLARLDETQKHHLHYLTTSADSLPFDDDFIQKQKKQTNCLHTSYCDTHSHSSNCLNGLTVVSTASCHFHFCWITSLDQVEGMLVCQMAFPFLEWKFSSGQNNLFESLFFYLERPPLIKK